MKHKRTHKRKGKKKETLKTLSREVHKLMKEPEWKNIDAVTFNAGFVQGFAGDLLFLLNGLSQGITQYSRIGDKVTAKKLEIIMYPSLPDAFSQYATFRFIIFWDAQANGNLCPVQKSIDGAGLLDDTYSVAPDPVFSPLNSDAVKNRYHILYDKLHTLNPSSNSSATDTCAYAKHIKLSIKLRDKVVVYDGTGSTVAAINTNSLLLYVAADAPSVDPMGMNGLARFYFIDV